MKKSGIMTLNEIGRIKQNIDRADFDRTWHDDAPSLRDGANQFSKLMLNITVIAFVYSIP